MPETLSSDLLREFNTHYSTSYFATKDGRVITGEPVIASIDYAYTFCIYSRDTGVLVKTKKSDLVGYMIEPGLYPLTPISADLQPEENTPGTEVFHWVRADDSSRDLLIDKAKYWVVLGEGGSRLAWAASWDEEKDSFWTELGRYATLEEVYWYAGWKTLKHPGKLLDR